ncbi:MAG: hypothetical protein HRU01_00820 [Myxococcales bacterium]|nr:hypothetical protein [Myxococcales bacterium]
MQTRPASKTFRNRRAWRAACTLAVSFGIAACSGTRAPAAPDWPNGFAISARRDAVLRLLTSLASLAGTPIAARAVELRDRLPNCPLLEAHDAAGDLGVALGSLRCAEPTGPLGLLERRRADRDLAFSLRWTDSAALLGSADIAPDGGIESEIELPDAALTGAAKLLLPGEAPPGRAQLASRDSLVHVRVRPSGGLDLTSLVPAGGQADRMFQLRSALFSGVLLEGSWEVALYVPADGQRMPRGALALGVTQRAAAVAAMDAFVDALREAWPMRRSEFSLGDAAGACLPDLNLAPDLAPCYLATGDQLVIGWNAASLRHALAAPAEEAFGSLGGAYIAFDRFAPADRALAAAWTRVDAPSGEGDVEGGEAAPPAGALQYPWRRLVAEGWRRDDIVHIRLLLEAEDT